MSDKGFFSSDDDDYLDFMIFQEVTRQNQGFDNGLS